MVGSHSAHLPLEPAFLQPILPSLTGLLEPHPGRPPAPGASASSMVCLSLSTIFIITSLGGTSIHAVASSMLHRPSASWLPDHPRLSKEPASTCGFHVNELSQLQGQVWTPYAADKALLGGSSTCPFCIDPSSIAWRHARFPTSKLLHLLVPLPWTSASPPKSIKPLFILDLGQLPPFPQSLQVIFSLCPICSQLLRYFSQSTLLNHHLYASPP